MTNILHADFETRSRVELRGPKSVGLWNYANHPSTEPLILGWALNNDPVQIWRIYAGESAPKELDEILQDTEVSIGAFNSTFERYIFQFKLGRVIPIQRFQDPQASARYLSLPGDLDEVSGILGLPSDLAKDKRGKKLIDLFSKPHKAKKKRGEEAEFFFNDWNSHPKEWDEFISYCEQDVIAEREVMRRETLLQVMPLPLIERQIWTLDQIVNDRGIPIDEVFVRNALELATQEKKEKIALNNLKTGLENSNSNDQMLDWAVGQGYDGRDPKDKDKLSLHKDAIVQQLKNNTNLTPLCREVLEIRKSASSTSYKKMAAILRQVSPDHRLRNQFIYGGSSRCLRWSGNAVQLHNMARPNEIFEVEENVDKARSLIYAMEYAKIKELFDSVLLTVKYNIRTAFVAEKGKRFNVSDLSSIETCVGAWVSECQALLDVFANKRDAYLDFAVKMTQIAYDILERDIKSKDPVVKARAKKLRQMAKPAVLGCIYRMGAKTFKEYAEGYGVILTLEEAAQIVKVFRDAYREIVDMWSKIEKAIEDVLDPTKRGVKRYVGPNDCIEISKFIFTCNGNERTILKIKLPSGRCLHYMDARIEETLMPWKNEEGEDVYRPSLVYATQDQKTKQWSTTTSHGGKVFENIVQGIARDVLAAKLLLFEDAGLWVVGHVHDEGITETEDDLFAPGILEMEAIMKAPIDWAPNLPLGSDGFEAAFYHK